MGEEARVEEGRLASLLCEGAIEWREGDCAAEGGEERAAHRCVGRSASGARDRADGVRGWKPYLPNLYKPGREWVMGFGLLQYFRRRAL